MGLLALVGLLAVALVLGRRDRPAALAVAVSALATISAMTAFLAWLSAGFQDVG